MDCIEPVSGERRKVEAYRCYWLTYEPFAKLMSGDRLPYFSPFPSLNFAPWNHHAAHSIPKMVSKWDGRSSTQSFARGSYLHYALDSWFERRFRTGCSGYARLIRHADDFIVCFQQESDAKRFRIEMETRLNQCSLELALKTRVLEFGLYAQQHARKILLVTA